MAFQAPYTAADEVAAQTYFDDVMTNRTPRTTITEGVNALLCVAALNEPQFAEALLDKQEELTVPDKVCTAARAGLAISMVENGSYADPEMASKYQHLLEGEDSRFIGQAFLTLAQRDRDLASAVLHAEVPIFKDPQMQEDILAASSFCLATREKASREQYQELLYSYVELRDKYEKLYLQVEALENEVAFLRENQETMQSKQESMTAQQERMEDRQNRMEELLKQISAFTSLRDSTGIELQTARKELEDFETVTRTQEDIVPLPVLLKQDDRMSMIRNLPKTPEPSHNDYTRRFVLAMQDGMDKGHYNTYVADAARLFYQELGAPYKKQVEDFINKYAPRAVRDKTYGHAIMEQVAREVKQEKISGR